MFYFEFQLDRIKFVWELVIKSIDNLKLYWLSAPKLLQLIFWELNNQNDFFEEFILRICIKNTKKTGLLNFDLFEPLEVSFEGKRAFYK